MDFLKLDETIYAALEKSVSIKPVRLCKLIAYYYTDARIRKLYLKRIGVELGENTFSNLGLLVVPNDNETCVSIGKNVSLAPNITFVCHSSANNGQEINQLSYVQDVLAKKGNIIVEDEVWIGAGVTILPDVTIGRCSVIGAGSIVTKDVEPYSVYVGAPARKIRDLKTGERV